MSDTSSDSPGVVIFPPLLFLLCVALGVLAHLTCPYRLAPSPWLRGLGGVLAVGAIALAIWGRRTMKAAGTNVDPSLPALAIVSGGPFAFTRNPLYLALIVLFTAIGVALADPSFLVFLLPLTLVLQFGVVLREERYLDAKFGAVYRGYKAHVRRWI
jgi:protein-S-isoprenylcysteine O-methyltransferase Ste14